METFPAQYSTLSASALKDHVQKKYGLGNLNCRLLTKNVSDTYLLEDEQECYILKIYRTDYKTLDEIEGEAELLQILKNKGVPISYPIADLNNDNVQRFHAAEGIRYGILFSFAKGKVMINPDGEQLGIVGRNIALMHNITCKCTLQHHRITYDVDSTIKKPLELIKGRFDGLVQEYAYLQGLAQQVTERLERYDTSTFSYGYCHYDLLPKNFHFDENNNITFFDFDWMGKGLLVNDLMTFFVQLFFLAHMNIISKEEADEKMAKVVAGYREVRAVSSQELELIPYLGVAFWIYGFGFYEENYDDFAIAFLTPRFIKERIALIKKWAQWYCGF